MIKCKRLFFFDIRIFTIVVLFFCSTILPAQEESKKNTEIASDVKTEESVSEEELSDEEKNREVLKYGLETEITSLISTLMSDENTEYSDDIYKIFQSTKSISVREKCIEYFTKIKDKRLSAYAVELLEDPYDEKKSTVDLVFKYVSALEIKEAGEPVLKLFQSENEDYFDNALSALGKVGSDKEADILVQYLDKEELTTAQRQSLMRVLGELKAVSTWDKLVEIITDTDENSFVRMYAAEAIGKMEKTESISILVDLYEDSDPNIRLYALKGLENFKTDEVNNTIIQAIKDSYYKVRIEAAEAAKKNELKDAMPVLIYRAKNDSESVVKYSCFDSIGALNTKEGNDFLISIIKDKKKSDTIRAKAAAVLLEYKNAGIDEIIEVAKQTLEDDKQKTLRYALGKEIAKYTNSKFEEICEAFLANKDVATKGTGLDIYSKNEFPSLKEKVKEIADNEKEGVNSKKAKRILGE